jgi:hypothetical protein
MRLYRLFALAAPLALLLPMAAHAATASDWPPPGRDGFVKECVDSASKGGMDQVNAVAHCTCGANTVQHDLSSAELKVLDSKTADGEAARAKMLGAVGEKCKSK